MSINIIDLSYFQTSTEFFNINILKFQGVAVDSKMLNLKFCFSLLLYISFIQAGFIQDKLFDGIEIHIDRLDSQCRVKKVPIQGFYRGMKTKSTKLYVENCTIVVKEGTYNKLLLNVVINRCRAKENLDTCEQYLKQDKIDFCKAIDPSNPLISESPFYTPFEPPLYCPVSKGVYTVLNLDFDLAPFILFKLEGWYWKVGIEIFSKDQNMLVFCSAMEGYVTKPKSKKN